MHKYEIMLLVNPKSEEKEIFDFINNTFSKKQVKKAEKLERTDLAYPINKSEKAQYFLFELEAEAEQIFEFKRLANISKDIWRHLLINLDTERGYGKERKLSPQKRYRLNKAKMTKENDSTEKPVRERKPRATRAKETTEDAPKKRTRKVETKNED